MLECGINFKGTLSSQCLLCNVPDNENHRLNVCPSYGGNNFVSDTESIPFDTILSRINKVWKNGHGSMILT